MNQLFESNELYEMLRKTAPGTNLREGLDHVLRANTGALIIIGDEEKINPIADGGFAIDSEYSPAHLYELAKMDGAILINSQCTRIHRANTHLNPDPNIPSDETGIRHRTAEQTARQTGELVISISQRRRIITLYKGHHKYVLRDINALLNTANQAVGTLDKYKNVFADSLLRLSIEEFDNIVSLMSVIQVVQRAEMLKRVEGELALYITELGNESRLIRMQAEELIANVDFEERLTLRDYLMLREDMTIDEQIDSILGSLGQLSHEDLFDKERIAQYLGYSEYQDKDKRTVIHSRGYRLLNKIPRLPSNIIENVVKSFGELQYLLSATIEELDDVDGVGLVRAQQISTGLERLRAQTISDRHWA